MERIYWFQKWDWGHNDGAFVVVGELSRGAAERIFFWASARIVSFDGRSSKRGRVDAAATTWIVGEAAADLSDATGTRRRRGPRGSRAPRPLSAG